MSSRRLDLVVFLDAPELGPARPVGVLTRWSGPILSVAFAYARSWLQDTARRFAIDPALPLDELRVTVPGRRIPGIFQDTTPDRWGEALLVRRAGGRALGPWEFLVGVADETRMGALRLRLGVDGPFIAGREPAVPSVHRLPELQELARRFEDDPCKVSDARIAMLVAPGSSLGGMRPKANFVAADGGLWIAKFPSGADRLDVAAWEQVYACLARAAGIAVSETELLAIAGPRRTFATRRFDRTVDGRRLYASALTLTARADARDADYIDIVQAISDHGASRHVRDDLAQLYRRMAFNVLAGNRDDHLRNHGFLRHADGWRLAAAFDLNPAREMREHSTAINGTVVAPSAADVLAARSFFGLSDRGARSIIREVAAAVGEWRRIATATGIERSEQQQVAGALAALDTAARI
ncbi:MAG: type II toxin-antitoxin system HipA family toxin [Deltaproteobacteria bacterium]|nr:type II toxin-antitoxin system HipA family toxin [Deltaproteobacteria bacterium]